MKWHDIGFLILNDNSSLFVSQYLEVHMTFLIHGEVILKLQFFVKICPHAGTYPIKGLEGWTTKNSSIKSIQHLNNCSIPCFSILSQWQVNNQVISIHLIFIWFSVMTLCTLASMESVQFIVRKSKYIVFGLCKFLWDSKKQKYIRIS